MKITNEKFDETVFWAEFLNNTDLLESENIKNDLLSETEEVIWNKKKMSI